MKKSAVVQSRMDILDLAAITRHFVNVHDVKPGSISETISIAIQVLISHLHVEPFGSPTAALEYMHDNGYGKTLKTGSRALARQIAEEELVLTGPPDSPEAAEISPGTLKQLNKIREEGTKT